MNKEGWEVKKLESVAEILMGQSPPSESYNTENLGLPFFQGNADFGVIYPKIRMYCDNPTRVAEINDILFSVRAPIGAINITLNKCCIGRGLASIRPNENIAKQKFIYRCLLHNRDKLISLGTGSTFKAINKKNLTDFPIPVPPLPIQEQIVAELDALNDILAKKRQQLTELDTLAQATFYHLFGDPVENEKGWEVKRLEQIVSKLGDGIHGTPKYSDNGEYYFINGNNLKDGKIEITPTTKRVSKEEAKIHNRELNRNTVFVSINGTIGNIAFYNNEKIILGKSACYFNLQEDYNKIFIYRLFKTDYFFNYAMGESTGSTIRNVSLKTMRNFIIPIPPLALQNQFAEQIEAIEKQKELINQSITEVQKLFDYTMDKYFN